jgi:hypothetical protein
MSTVALASTGSPAGVTLSADALAFAPTDPRAHDPAVGQASKVRPAGAGRRLLFSVSFTTRMTDEDIVRLTRTLNLDTHFHPKLRDSPSRPGLARLDFDSGLFLLRGGEDDRWVLEGRTWGDPPPQSVLEWHLRAITAARQLDPTVTYPSNAPAAR